MLGAALFALAADDLKRVLAWSTVSQLAYMFAGLSLAGYAAGVLHLLSHGAFKALLFLAAGSVIHAVGTQRIDAMGGLRRGDAGDVRDHDDRLRRAGRGAAARRLLLQGRRARAGVRAGLRRAPALVAWLVLVVGLWSRRADGRILDSRLADGVLRAAAERQTVLRFRASRRRSDAGPLVVLAGASVLGGLAVSAGLPRRRATRLRICVVVAGRARCGRPRRRSDGRGVGPAADSATRWLRSGGCDRCCARESAYDALDRWLIVRPDAVGAARATAAQRDRRRRRLRARRRHRRAVGLATGALAARRQRPALPHRRRRRRGRRRSHRRGRAVIEGPRTAGRIASSDRCARRAVARPTATSSQCRSASGVGSVTLVAVGLAVGRRR